MRRAMVGLYTGLILGFATTMITAAVPIDPRTLPAPVAAMFAQDAEAYSTLSQCYNTGLGGPPGTWAPDNDAQALMNYYYSIGWNPNYITPTWYGYAPAPGTIVAEWVVGFANGNKRYPRLKCYLSNGAHDVWISS